MAKRNRQHAIGDIASGNVQLVFLEGNWVVNTIASDYGEDLLVSPTQEDEVDTFHLFVQVKGKDNDVKVRSDGAWTRSFESKDVERWLRMKEPVVVALWSLEDSCGRFCMPREEHRLSELLSKIKKRSAKKRSTPPTVTLEFKEENSLKVDSLNRLAWWFRLAYAAETCELYANAYQEAKDELRGAKLTDGMVTLSGRLDYSSEVSNARKALKQAQQELDERLDEVLIGLKVLEPKGLDSELVQKWAKESTDYISANSEMTDEEVHETFCQQYLAKVGAQLNGRGMISSLADLLARRIVELWPRGAMNGGQKSG